MKDPSRINDMTDFNKIFWNGLDKVAYTSTHGVTASCEAYISFVQSYRLFLQNIETPFSSQVHVNGTTAPRQEVHLEP